MSAHHINLRKSHRLLFRLYLVKASIAAVNGLGILLLPAFFLGSTGYNVITNLLPLYLTGSLFLAFGLMVILSLFALPYKMARLGIGGLSVLYFAWAVSILTNNILLYDHPTGLFAVGVYLSLAIASFVMLLEPPINPETAIKTNKE